MTLNEAADRMGKSVQTLRRMIRKGELQTERIETPQGFQYWVHVETTEAAPEPEQQLEPEIEVIPETKIEMPEPQPMPEPVKPSKEAHEERMFFLRLIERLQNELDYERKKPRSLFGVLADWWTQLF